MGFWLHSKHLELPRVCAPIGEIRKAYASKKLKIPRVISSRTHWSIHGAENTANSSWFFWTQAAASFFSSLHFSNALVMLLQSSCWEVFWKLKVAIIIIRCIDWDENHFITVLVLLKISDTGIEFIWNLNTVFCLQNIRVFCQNINRFSLFADPIKAFHASKICARQQSHRWEKPRKKRSWNCWEKQRHHKTLNLNASTKDTSHLV